MPWYGVGVKDDHHSTPQEVDETGKTGKLLSGTWKGSKQGCSARPRGGLRRYDTLRAFCPARQVTAESMWGRGCLPLPSVLLCTVPQYNGVPCAGGPPCRYAVYPLPWPSCPVLFFPMLADSCMQLISNTRSTVSSLRFRLRVFFFFSLACCIPLPSSQTSRPPSFFCPLPDFNKQS